MPPAPRPTGNLGPIDERVPTYDPATLGYWAIGPAVVVVFAVAGPAGRQDRRNVAGLLSAQPGSSGELHTLRFVVFVGVPLRGDHRGLAAAAQDLDEAPGTGSEG